MAQANGEASLYTNSSEYRDLDLGELIDGLFMPHPPGGRVPSPVLDVEMEMAAAEGDGAAAGTSGGDKSLTCCWGAVLKGDESKCTAGFASGKAHFKNKFCFACRDGIDVPAERVRALRPEMRQYYANSLRAGF